MTNNWEDQLMVQSTTPSETLEERTARIAKLAKEREKHESELRAAGFPANWREAQEYSKSIGDW
jgi:hypothetical protein